MKKLFYRSLVFVSGLLGGWFFKLVAGGIASGYFLLFPSRLKNSLHFYGVLFPQKSRLGVLWCAYRQYLSFTLVFFERMRFMQGRMPKPIRDGYRHIQEALANGSGAVILMSHMGNWEIAAQLLNQMDAGMRVLIFMGRRREEEIEGLQKSGLARSGIQVLAVEDAAASAWNILEGVRFLRAGGLVCITGDRLWSGQERSLQIPFLGYPARIPEAPFRLALAARAPMIPFFCLREKGGGLRLTASRPIRMEHASGAKAALQVTKAAKRYAALMESMVRRYPSQWYHFEPFLNPHDGGDAFLHENQKKMNHREQRDIPGENNVKKE